MRATSVVTTLGWWLAGQPLRVVGSSDLSPDLGACRDLVMFGVLESLRKLARTRAMAIDKRYKLAKFVQKYTRALRLFPSPSEQ